MDDQTKYVNAYLENAVGMTHDYLNTILQLKTQLKVSNDLVAEKDSQLSTLAHQVNQLLERVQSLEPNNEQLEKRNQELITENQALAGKASHIDTFSRQIADNNRMMQEKDKLINRLTTDLEEKDKLINTLTIDLEEKDKLIKELKNSNNKKEISTNTINKKVKITPSVKLDDINKNTIIKKEQVVASTESTSDGFTY